MALLAGMVRRWLLLADIFADPRKLLYSVERRLTWLKCLSALSLGHFLCSRTVSAQFPPPISNDPDIRTVKSPTNDNITVTFKSPPPGTCVTIFQTQKQYTGFVTIPPFTLLPVQQNYTINTFFWFIEARQTPEIAPLTIYLNGGPGSSSMVGLFQEVGPCEVVELTEDQLGTQARIWGWDRSSNLLFIDQPDQVGFSYDAVTNASLNLLSGDISYPPTDVPNGQLPYSFLNGSFGSGNQASTANTSNVAAQATWHMLQAFLGAFPQYNSGNRTTDVNAARTAPIGINLFAESYGGHYGPAFASFWESQNQLRRIGSIPSNSTVEIHLASLGIIQGCVDDLVQGEYYPRFASNNTYGIQAISLAGSITAAGEYVSANGCQQLLESCRAAALMLDPNNYGDSQAVNDKCKQAQSDCQDHVVFGPYSASGRSIYDITQSDLNPFPKSTYLEYLNMLSVQKAIGSPVNYTETSAPVVNAFQSTGDYAKGNQISALASLLNSGIRVALIYGDRDYACNWLGGEALSFSIAGSVPQYTPFYGAGYAPLVTNSNYVGGVVRQFGNLSFTRIYDAGHLIGAYQPESLFELFSRIIQGVDLSKGQPVNMSLFGTTGDANATATNSAPAMADPTCYLRAVDTTCNDEQQNALSQGRGVIINGVWYEKSSDWTPPPRSLSSLAGQPGTAPTSTKTPESTSARGGRDGGGTSALTQATGVYVASTVPTTSTRKSGLAVPAHSAGVDGAVMLCLVTVLVLSA